ncbi:glycosyltransferase family 4 protein [Corynebacterium callunae]|uniref:glycosyltransferase family 4 protein n=1 Tax=Corynebacterium callunae TaxID=1721 RepID=UPI003982D6E1
MKSKFKPKTIVISVTVDHAIQYHKDLANELMENGWNVHFISSGGSALKSLARGIETHEVKMERNPSPLKDLKSLIRWITLLKDIRPIAVIAGTPKASMLGILAAKFLGVPVRIYWVHGLRLETATGPFRLLLLAIERFTAMNSTKLLAVSMSLREALKNLKISQSNKIEVLGRGSTQGVELSIFSRELSDVEKFESLLSLGLDPKLPVVGFVGRLTADKGIAELRDALISLSKNGLPVQLLLVGPIEDEMGLAVIEQLKNEGVKLAAPGRVNDVATYFKLMDVFCLPSYREGLPNVVLESFASEVPVVSTYITGVIDLIRHEENGLLVPIKSSDQLALAIERIILNPALASKLASAALQDVEHYFDSKKVIESQLRFIELEVVKILQN